MSSGVNEVLLKYTTRVVKWVVSEPLLVCVFLAAIISYYPAFSYGRDIEGFIMDDAVAVKRNPLVTGDTVTLSDYFRKDFWGLDLFAGTWTHKSFRPITTFSYRLNYLLHGIGSSGFHAVNVILHAVVSVMLGKLAREMFGYSKFWSAIVGGIFACHPVHTENVLYLVGRADILATLLSIISLQMYHRDNTIMACVFVGLSGLAKEVGFMVLPVLIVLEMVKVLRRAKDRDMTKMYILVLASCLFFLLRHRHTSGTSINMSVQDNPIQFETSWLTRFLSFSYIHGIYMRLLIFPFQLCYDYSLNAIPLLFETSDIRLLLPLTGYSVLFTLVFLTLAEIRKASDKKGEDSETSRSLTSYSVFGLGFTVLTFFPASNILFPVGTVVGERLLYLPSLGYAIGLVGLLRYFQVSKGIAVWIVFILGYRNLLRTDDWKDAATLFLRDGVKQPKSAKTQFNIGVTYFQQQQWPGAIKGLLECAKADPMSALPYWRIGQIEILRGNFDTASLYLMEATTKFSATLMIKDEELFHDLSVALFQLGRKDRSEFYLSIALEINQKFPKGVNNFGCLMASKGELAKAMEYIKMAVKWSPDHPLYLNNLAFFASHMNDQQLYRKVENKLISLGNRINTNHKDCIWEFKPAS
jgi:protein O-mannosyl-transferase